MFVIFIRLTHPHTHCVVAGGGLSPDHERWISAQRKFLLPVKTLSRYFRDLMLEALAQAYADGLRQFFGEMESLGDPGAFAQFLAPLKHKKWWYTPSPLEGPAHVLEYLGRYTHRVAISNPGVCWRSKTDMSPLPGPTAATPPHRWKSVVERDCPEVLHC